MIGDWIESKYELEIAKTYDEKKIKYFADADMNKLVAIIAEWRLLLGVTSESSKEELIVICRFLKEHYGKFTLNDIRTCMNWSIAGTIDIGFVSQKNISAFYVSKSLQAYEIKKRDIVNEIGIKKEKYITKEKLKNSISLTPEQKAKIHKDYVVSLYFEYKKNDNFYDFGDILYEWLRKIKLLNPNKQVVADALDYAIDKIKDYKKNEKQKTLFTKNKMEGTVDLELLKKKYARQYVIGKLFDDMPIENIISHINVKDFT